MSETYSWLALLDPMDDDAMMRAFTAVDFDEYSQEDQDTLRHIIRTIRGAIRRQALEEAAKVAESVTKQEVAGLGLEDPIRNGIRWTGARITGEVRALASDAVKK